MRSQKVRHSWATFTFFGASLVAQTVKRLPTVRETWMQSLGQEDVLEKEMATHSSILAWKIPWMEKPGRLRSMGLERVGHDRETSLSFSGISSVQFSRSVVWPHEPQHTRPPCPSPTAGVYPNSRPLSRWCHLTILSSVIPFSCLQSFPH